MGQALAARTLGDVRELMSDLPSAPDPVGTPPGDRTSLPYLAVLPGIAALCALAVIALVVYGGHSGNHHPLREPERERRRITHRTGRYRT